MYLIKKNNILDLVTLLQKEYEVYGPISNMELGQVIFGEIKKNDNLDLDAPLPLIPPKDILFPQVEKIMKYRYSHETKEAEVNLLLNKKKRAFFGMRSCDLVGIQCLDRFFLGQEFVDEFYLYNRKNTFIVTNTCTTPFEHCFCLCTDSGPAAREGYDLQLTDLGVEYLVEVGSEKGQLVMKKMNCKKAQSNILLEKQKVVENCIGLFDEKATGSKAWISRVMNRVTTGFIKEEIWEYIGNQCFECGACSFVCPSCSCFNIDDAKINAEETERLRSWDSCAYEGYSRMAGGHNPRKPIEDRRNKRFFCKLSYSQSKKYLRPGCVGCGRCARVCPGDIGLPNVVTYIRREIQAQEK